MGDQNAVDLRVFGELLDSVGGDPDFMTELTGTYLNDTPQMIQAMRRALIRKRSWIE